MASNVAAVFAKTPKFGSVVATAANAKSDGTGTIGTDIYLAYTAGTDGARIDKLRVLAQATAANVVTAATILRIYISTQSTGATTSANTYLWKEITYGSITAGSSTNAQNEVEFEPPSCLQGGYSILFSTHVVANANTGWRLNVIAGDFS